MLEWNVYRYNINRNTIDVFNVFTHWSFAKDVDDIMNRNLSYDEFSKELNSVAMYYFWCKFEHEIVVTSFPPYINKKEISRIANECDMHPYRTNVNLDNGMKVDVYEQLKLNWDRFASYIYGRSKPRGVAKND